MRNMIGGIIGAIIGTICIVFLRNPEPITYPSPYDILSPLLHGSILLQDLSMLFLFHGLLGYLLVWFAVGLIGGIFSESKWNTIRTVFWTGVVIAILSIISMILEDSTFWTGDQNERNLIILFQFIKSIGASMLALLSAVPVVLVKKQILSENESIAPPIIESTCECGAVFKSNPIICSECGNVLRPKALELITVPE
ncbi:MAG: hypothetical protein GF411_11150 [Candidatus Lokiarchaeota archaeon]|nr:hypothetical protein [Candidatus Lokiarchaeota archaeon]